MTPKCTLKLAKTDTGKDTRNWQKLYPNEWPCTHPYYGRTFPITVMSLLEVLKLGFGKLMFIKCLCFIIFLFYILLFSVFENMDHENDIINLNVGGRRYKEVISKLVLISP